MSSATTAAPPPVIFSIISPSRARGHGQRPSRASEFVVDLDDANRRRLGGDARPPALVLVEQQVLHREPLGRN